MTRSDAELLRDHLAGDTAAFADLARRHEGLLWSIARRTLDSPEDAEEVVWDTLRRAHQGADRFRADASVRNWLVRILVNACRDRHRRNRARPAVPVAGVELADMPAPRDPIADCELRIDLEVALNRLPKEQRLAVVLVDVHGYPVAEAASVLKVPVGTVKSRCARGRARLNELLGAPVGTPVGEEP